MGADSPASTSSRNASVWSSARESGVASKPKPSKLPPCAWREEVAIGRAAVPARRRATRALQNELPAHEFAIIFAHRAFRRGEARIGSETALGPFPDVAEEAATRARTY